MKKEGMQEHYLELVERVNAEGPYRPDWESLSGSRLPEWFDEERLGIFLHLGVYSVPAYANEWYPRNMYIQGTDEFAHHVKTYGPHREFGYKDFIPLFRLEHFDAEEWIRIFREAGAGYVFPVAEHHDGFQMYKSELSDFNAADMGPCRDVAGELREAARKEGMHFCASSHRAEHWFFMGHGREFESDIHEPLSQGDFYWPAMPEGPFEDWTSRPYPDEEYKKDWLARTAELIVRYEPELLYFDWWVQHEAFSDVLKKLAAFYYNMGERWGKKTQICYKHDAMAFGSGIVDVERGGFRYPVPYRWQTDTATAYNSWCYTDSLRYKTTRDIILTLVDVVSKNGNLLLNVGPKADGTIPEGDREILAGLGRWMAVNREAINGTIPWRTAMEGRGNIQEGSFQEETKVEYTSADYRFTSRKGAVYAICLVCPEDGEFCVRSFAASPDPSAAGVNLSPFHGIVREVSILGYPDTVQWHVDQEGLHVLARTEILKKETDTEFPVVIRIIT